MTFWCGIAGMPSISVNDPKDFRDAMYKHDGEDVGGDILSIEMDYMEGEIQEGKETYIPYFDVEILQYGRQKSETYVYKT